MRAFTKKELLGQLRTHKILILSLVFALFGFMNPAVAKLTPWLMDVLSESLAQSGMNITGTSVSALDSWAQFFKNMPMALIAFILLEGNIFTREYQKGTLILSVTKGLDRYKVVLSKMLVLSLFWTVAYWLCFGITYGCTAIFWDNSVAQNLIFAALCWWVFGLWTVSLLVLFSVLFRSFGIVLAGTGGVAFACYLLGALPKIGRFFPAYMANGAVLAYGIAERSSYFAAVIISIATGLLCFVLSIPVFNRKEL